MAELVESIEIGRRLEPLHPFYPCGFRAYAKAAPPQDDARAVVMDGAPTLSRLIASLL